ncbi:MAG: restriction endonuclease subunit S [Bacteroidaceae bacterium]|nr:restriction endonuclease subunit S [Bacteroidaceae bacterium]
MSEWKCYKLNDISSLSNGINFDKSAYTSGVKLIGVSDFKNRIHPDYDSLQEVDSKVVKSGDYLEKGDIVFVRSNGNKELVGRCMMIDRDIPVTYSGFCIKLRLKDKKIFDPVFFNYLFKTRQFKKSMTGTAVGANIQNLSQSRLGSCEVNVPDIETQKKIATILSRYDSLIENYQKQIKLLEEAAQRLYKEWFVDHHFPGHENTKIVDGVPEGWEEKSISEVFDFKYGKILPTKDFVEDGPIPVYGASKQIGRYTKANCFEPKVLIGSRGNAGFVHRTIEDETYVTNNSFIVEPCAKYGYLKLPFIFESFKVLDFVAICTGAAQPQLTLNSISSLKYIVPIKDLIVRYCGITTCYFSKIALAYKQIHLLTEARDRLLPRLMNGEFDV